jgi:hypothetical protein
MNHVNDNIEHPHHLSLLSSKRDRNV